MANPSRVSRKNLGPNLISEKDLVSFHDVGDLRTGFNIGDATIRHHADNSHLADQLAVATDHHDGVGQHILFFTDVQYHKIPLRIHHHDFAFQTQPELHHLRFIRAD